MYHERRPSVELQSAGAGAATSTTTTTTTSAPYPTPSTTYPAGGGGGSPVYVTSVPGSSYPTSTMERPGTTTYYPASASLERPGSVYATSTMDRNDRHDRHTLLPAIGDERSRRLERHEDRYRRDMKTIPIPQSGFGGFLARHDTMYEDDRSLYKVRSSPILQLLNTLAYFAALAITILCVAEAFGQTFMGVWDEHTTRFTPAAYVLVLWIVIFFFLALFILYQLPRYQHSNLVVFRDIGFLFVLACILNIIYNIFYVLEFFWAAAGVCTGLLCVLIIIYLRIGIGWKRAVAPLEYICVHVPFGLWLGWISVETVILWATAAFSHLGWNGRPWTGEGWAVLFMCMLLLIAVLMLLFKRDGPYGLAVGFAIVAIAVKQSRREPIPLTFYIAGGVLMVLSILALLVKLCLYSRERREKRKYVHHHHDTYVAPTPVPVPVAVPAPTTYTTTYATAPYAVSPYSTVRP